MARPTRARLPCSPHRFAAADARTVRTAPKTAAPIYQTAEFREWRSIVIRRAGRACQGQGCGRTNTRLFADHIVELRDGGAPFDPNNGQALCGSCHTTKTAAERARRTAGIG